jgi:uncharacterized membrane protein
MNHRGAPIFLLIITLLYTPNIQAQELSPISLTITIYLNGEVDVNYIIEPDVTYPTVNVTLPGQEYSDILVNNEDGLLLDWEPIHQGIEIDSLGSKTLYITYSTTTLTNKTRQTWTISLNAPINTIYILPKEAVLTGLTPSPIGISIINNQATVTMPPGESRITYLLETSGTRENALLVLNYAEQALSGTREKGITITEAEELLTDAWSAYEAKQYSESEAYSYSAMGKSDETEALAKKADEHIKTAYEIVEALPTELQTGPLNMIDSADSTYASGDYEAAYTYAEQAITTAQASQSTGNNYTLYIVSGLILIALIVGYLYMRKKPETITTITKTTEKPSEIHIEEVFSDNPTLRTDEKAVLRYIQESGGAFITDIRNQFDIPKSSAWRMMKRLEEEGLIETSMVDRETYVQLRSREL